MVLSDEGQALVKTFGFAAVPSTLVVSGIDALSKLTMPTGPDGTDWTFENATSPGTGMGGKVFSVKRQSYSDVQRDMVGWCRLTGSKPVLKAPMVSAFEA